MTTIKALNWIISLVLAALVAAEAPMAGAFPAGDEADEADAGPPGPDGFGPKGGSASAAVPVAIPLGQNPPIGANVQLIGTAVVVGGPSIAFLQLATGARSVREGDEIVAGIRLVKVWRNRIDVERAGVHQEIRPGPGEVPADRVGPGSMPTLANQGDVDRLRETYGRTGRSLFYSHYRRP